VFYETCGNHSIHAEKKAIINAKNKQILHECIIIIIKLVNNIISFTTPCDMCKKLLHKYNITKIYSINSNFKLIRL
jgi:cytidine deaminase